MSCVEKKIIIFLFVCFLYIYRWLSALCGLELGVVRAVPLCGRATGLVTWKLSCAGVSVFRDGSQWRAEFHVVSEHRIQSVVLAVIRDCAEW